MLKNSKTYREGIHEIRLLLCGVQFVLTSGSAGEESVQLCGICGAALLFAGHSAGQWKLLSSAEKEVVINAMACRAQMSPKEKTAQTAQGFSWTGALRVLSWLSFAGTILIGIILAVFAADSFDFGASPF